MIVSFYVLENLELSFSLPLFPSLDVLFSRLILRDKGCVLLFYLKFCAGNWRAAGQIDCLAHARRLSAMLRHVWKCSNE